MQRAALSPTAILGIARETVQPGGLGDIRMDVHLRADPDPADPMSATYVSRLRRGHVSPPSEEWLFVNGIANEFVWFQRSCDKIRDTFRRKVRGV